MPASSFAACDSVSNTVVGPSRRRGPNWSMAFWARRPWRESRAAGEVNCPRPPRVCSNLRRAARAFAKFVRRIAADESQGWLYRALVQDGAEARRSRGCVSRSSASSVRTRAALAAVSRRPPRRSTGSDVGVPSDTSGSVVHPIVRAAEARPGGPARQCHDGDIQPAPRAQPPALTRRGP